MTRAQTMELISENAAGTAAGNGYSYRAVMSRDDRYVAFQSTASDLVAGDTNRKQDVFVRDRWKKRTALVSVNARGTGPANGVSGVPVMSPDGRYIAFISTATDLVDFPDGNGVADLFLRDMREGKTILVSRSLKPGPVVSAVLDVLDLDLDYNPIGHYSFIPLPTLSDDGRYVAFTSWSRTLSCMDPSSPACGTQLVMRDVREGTYHLVTVNASGTGPGNSWSRYSYAMSRDGRSIVFTSHATDLTSDGSRGIFYRDMNEGKTVFIGPEVDASVAISPDGRTVAYSTTSDVYAWDRDTRRKRLVSVTRSGKSSGQSRFNGFQPIPFSADGRYVMFQSTSNDLVAEDTRGEVNFFVRDLREGSTSLVSFGSSGPPGRDSEEKFLYSSPAAISGNGQSVVFGSYRLGGNEPATDQPSWGPEFHLRDLGTGSTYWISRRPRDLPPIDHNPSVTPTERIHLTPYPLSISEDGRTVVYASSADYLTDRQDRNGTADVFAFTLFPSVIKGDLDRNGRIDLVDVRRLLQLALGLRSASPYERFAGDVRPLPSGEGDLTVDDALTLLRSLFGIDRVS